MRVPDVFGVKAGFDLNASPFFPQCELATVTLVAGVVVLEELEPV